ncbi:hypothetical protein N9F50_00075 [Akkermansiaceae bacterium]|nr:hypothetical protein [Akkermansiaceae bacterium]
MKFTKIFAFLLAMTGLTAAELKKGSSLPKVEAQNSLGETVKIEEAKGDDYLLVFFYPKAMTGG